MTVPPFHTSTTAQLSTATIVAMLTAAECRDDVVRLGEISGLAPLDRIDLGDRWQEYKSSPTPYTRARLVELVEEIATPNPTEEVTE